MAAKAKVLTHPTSGDSLIVLITAEESGGALFRFEYVSVAALDTPSDHLHPDQEERIEVLRGTLRCRVAEREHELRPGDSIVIPAGVPHAIWNPDGAEARAIGEYRPALETQAMLEAYFTAA